MKAVPLLPPIEILACLAFKISIKQEAFVHISTQEAPMM